MSLGTAVVNEVVIPITGCLLEGGKLVLYGTRKGPVSAFAGGKTEVELFGVDGSACGSVRVSCPPWDGIDERSFLHLELPLHFAELWGSA